MTKSKLQKRKANVRSQYWLSKADQAWAKLIHEAGFCAVCGDTTSRLEAHHLITRSLRATRHDPLNGLLLCTSCHKFDKHLSAHMAPIAFAEWLRTTMPDRYEWVLEQKQIPITTRPKPDYKAAYERLRDDLTNWGNC